MNVSLSEILLFLVVPIFAASAIYMMVPDLDAWLIISEARSVFSSSWVEIAGTALVPFFVVLATFRSAITHNVYAALASLIAGLCVLLMILLINPSAQALVIAVLMLVVITFLADIEFLSPHVWGHAAILAALFLMNTEGAAWVQAFVMNGFISPYQGLSSVDGAGA